MRASSLAGCPPAGLLVLHGRPEASRTGHLGAGCPVGLGVARGEVGEAAPAEAAAQVVRINSDLGDPAVFAFGTDLVLDHPGINMPPSHCHLTKVSAIRRAFFEEAHVAQDSPPVAQAPLDLPPGSLPGAFGQVGGAHVLGRLGDEVGLEVEVGDAVQGGTSRLLPGLVDDGDHLPVRRVVSR